MKKPFTGRHMTMVLVGGFGIVIAVNFYMASLAVSGFGGVVVPNSYVASQKFNGWLEEAEQQRAFGWDVQISRDEGGNLVVLTEGVPEGAEMSASIRRPIGQPETTELSFVESDKGGFISSSPIPSGRWIVRLTIVSQGQRWSEEKRIE